MMKQMGFLKQELHQAQHGRTYQRVGPVLFVVQKNQNFKDRMFRLFLRITNLYLSWNDPQI